uniref:Uncharacterized protein n=1 Tax=Glossina austeni TaxID=7395 RepID=A0A1A9UJH0_GLOAU
MLLKDRRPKVTDGTARSREHFRNIISCCDVFTNCFILTVAWCVSEFKISTTIAKSHKTTLIAYYPDIRVHSLHNHFLAFELINPYLWHWQVTLCHDSNCLRHVRKEFGTFFKYGKSFRSLFSPGSVRGSSVKRRGGLILNLPFRCTLQEILIAARKGTFFRSLKT